MHFLKYFNSILGKNIPNVVISRTVRNFSVELNTEYLCNPENKSTISENITRRKGVGNIENVYDLYQQLKNRNKKDQEYVDIEQKFISEALKIPNDSHKDILNYDKDPKVLKYVGEKPVFHFKPVEFEDLTKNLNLMRTSQLGNVSGNRSYYFYSALAELEQALIKYTVEQLLKDNYALLSVPDILAPNIIESCGMNTKGERTQVCFSVIIN